MTLGCEALTLVLLAAAPAAADTTLPPTRPAALLAWLQAIIPAARPH